MTAGLIIAAATFSAYALAEARGLPLTQQRTAATLVTLTLSLCVLALLAMTLTWRRIALLVAALAAFVLLFPVPAVRTFYKLELPQGRSRRFRAINRRSLLTGRAHRSPAAAPTAPPLSCHGWHSWLPSPEPPAL